MLFMSYSSQIEEAEYKQKLLADIAKKELSHNERMVSTDKYYIKTSNLLLVSTDKYYIKTLTFYW